MKAPKPIKQTHTSRTKTGSGDFLGQAIKQKVGKPKQLMMDLGSKPKKTKAPRSLA